MFDTCPTPVIPVDNRITQDLIAPVQDDLVAKQAYAIGDLFIFNNGLYKVTTAIAQGGTIIIGTASGCNADVARTVAEERNIDFPNPSSVIKSNFGKSNSWTATEDGILYGVIQHQGSTDGGTEAWISVGGIIVSRAYAVGVYSGTYIWLRPYSSVYCPFKKGDVITTSSVGNYSGLRAVRIRR